MSRPFPLSLLSVPFALAVVLAFPAQAQRQQEQQTSGTERSGAQQQARGQQARGGQDSMAESIRHVRSSNRGQVLSAERMHSDGREINRIKMVDDRGRVRVFEDDPQQRRRQRSRRDDD